MREIIIVKYNNKYFIFMYRNMLTELPYANYLILNTENLFRRLSFLVFGK